MNQKSNHSKEQLHSEVLPEETLLALLQSGDSRGLEEAQKNIDDHIKKQLNPQERQEARKRTGVKERNSPGAAILSADSRLGALNPLLDQNVPEADNQHPAAD
jgi:hypothetical protein